MIQTKQRSVQWLRAALLSGVIAITLALSFAGATTATYAQSGAYRWQQYAKGFAKPTDLVTPPDGTRRMFVVEQAGTIHVIQPDGKVVDAPFLNVTNRLVSSGNEQGLLGLAFHPDYAKNRTFFVMYTNKKGEPTLARYQTSADNMNVADVKTGIELLSIPHPFQNHNGGQIVFGPDGYLYWGVGDGGAGGDPYDNGQNVQTLLGSILRLDVNADLYTTPADNPFKSVSKARAELWAIGLRNPWRFSFDAKTGDLYIADVGQNVYEEINFQPASSKGGENYGWAVFEADAEFKVNGVIDKSKYVFPVTDYAHGEDGCSVTGGYVYRGKALPALDGIYIYGDYCSGRMWTLRQTDGKWQNTKFMDSDLAITSYGLDADGELYVADRKSGAVFKLVAGS